MAVNPKPNCAYAIFQPPAATSERVALSNMLPTLGETTCDIYPNDRIYWRDALTAVWNYQLGGYQVLKKGCPTASIAS